MAEVHKEPKDYAALVARAMAQQDLGALGALAIELVGIVEVGDRRRRGARERKRRERGTVVQQVTESQLVLAVDDGRDTPDSVTCNEAKSVTSRDVTPPSPPSPSSFFPTPHITPSLPPPPRTTTTARGVDPATAASAAEQLVAAANRGLRTQFGGDVVLLTVDRYAAELVHKLASGGVPIGQAAQLVERRARRVREHPLRMAYFEPAIDDLVARSRGEQRARQTIGASAPAWADRAATAVQGVERTKAAIEQFRAAPVASPDEVAEMRAGLRAKLAAAGVGPREVQHA